jgi:proteic killer suppression protein
VIQSFRHRGLKRLYEEDDPRGVLAEHVPKLRNILARLDAATSQEDLNLPGFGSMLFEGSTKIIGR